MYPIEKYQFKVYEKTNEDDTKSSVVIALSTYCGKVVKGTAKCMSSDPFDLEMGKKLAAARCDYKVCVKRKKRAEAKRNEVMSKIVDLAEDYIKMCNYFDEALDEMLESKERLHDLEIELS